MIYIFLNLSLLLLLAPICMYGLCWLLFFLSVFTRRVWSLRCSMCLQLNMLMHFCGGALASFLFFFLRLSVSVFTAVAMLRANTTTFFFPFLCPNYFSPLHLFFCFVLFVELTWRPCNVESGKLHCDRCSCGGGGDILAYASIEDFPYSSLVSFFFSKKLEKEQHRWRWCMKRTKRDEVDCFDEHL